jgi:hypothetical protein
MHAIEWPEVDEYRADGSFAQSSLSDNATQVSLINGQVIMVAGIIRLHFTAIGFHGDQMFAGRHIEPFGNIAPCAFNAYVLVQDRKSVV